MNCQDGIPMPPRWRHIANQPQGEAIGRSGQVAKVSKVFISYRRDDAADLAGRIRDRMIQNWRLSKENVFMDIDNIKVGADFMQVIERTIRECQAMVILISPSWLAQVNKPGVSYVRVEAELAIRFRLRLIPLLVGGARSSPKFSVQCFW